MSEVMIQSKMFYLDTRLYTHTCSHMYTHIYILMTTHIYTFPCTHAPLHTQTRTHRTVRPRRSLSTTHTSTHTAYICLHTYAYTYIFCFIASQNIFYIVPVPAHCSRDMPLCLAVSVQPVSIDNTVDVTTTVVNPRHK
jgi:hypothetical protein